MNICLRKEKKGKFDRGLFLHCPALKSTNTKTKGKEDIGLYATSTALFNIKMSVDERCRMQTMHLNVRVPLYLVNLSVDLIGRAYFRQKEAH